MPSTLGTIRKIKDPIERAKAASILVRDAQEQGEIARRTRDMAALHLDEIEGWRLTDIVELIQVSRSLFVRIRDRSTAKVPGQVRVMENAEKIARDAGQAAIDWDAVADEGIKIRDEAILEALNAGERNADLARATGLTTARIAQIRKA